MWFIPVFILISIPPILTVIFVISHHIRTTYERQVLDCSEAIRALKEINKHYSFLEVTKFDIIHAYDNEKIFEIIQPKDYLIYKLDKRHNEVVEALRNTQQNSWLFQLYQS